MKRRDNVPALCVKTVLNLIFIAPVTGLPLVRPSFQGGDEFLDLWNQIFVIHQQTEFVIEVPLDRAADRHFVVIRRGLPS